jgi:hypothetical protein
MSADCQTCNPPRKPTEAEIEMIRRYLLKSISADVLERAHAEIVQAKYTIGGWMVSITPVEGVYVSIYITDHAAEVAA